MDISELYARENARDTIARYAWLGDRGRTAEQAALFAVDGELAPHRDEALRGRAAIQAYLDRLVAAGASAGPTRVRHHVSTVLFHTYAESAIETRSYFVVITDIGADHWGTYYDTFVHEADVWRFGRRSVRLEGMAAESWLTRARGSDAGDA
jgi:hypothetical protein